MKFSLFSRYLQKLEETTKRLEITSILSDMISNLSTQETDKALYLSLGYLKAPFESKKFNIAEKMMVKILEEAFGAGGKEVWDLYAKLGDLGTVAYELSKEGKNPDDTVFQVYEQLTEIAAYEGTGSQEKKIIKAARFLKNIDRLSVKFVTRIILGTTRLGFTELTVIDALSNLLKKDKSLRSEIERKYNLHPDIGLIGRKLKAEGIEGIRDVKIEVGIPILSQKAQSLGSAEEIIKKMGKGVWAEYKFDGTRVQLHLESSKGLSGMFVKTFTRNQEETTHQFPDIISAAKAQISAQSVILDGEAVGFDKKTGAFIEFQKTMQRKRKHNVEEMTKEIPLKYFVFDILYRDGKSLTDLPLSERRKILQSVVKKGEVIIVDEYLSTSDPEELNDYFEGAKEKGLEGLVVKSPGAAYQAGARSFAWVKFKQSESFKLNDTVDCVILGYFHGKGSRAEFGIGKVLAGIYDQKSNTFKTTSKVGGGLKEAELLALKKLADRVKVKEKPANYDVEKSFHPNVWMLPKIVIEVGADEISKSDKHTAGYALRFPRFLKFRDDKTPQDTTTIEELANLHTAPHRA